MNPDFAKLEDKILKFWEKQKIFEKSLEKTKWGKPYTFYDGPPFATGLPHYGHILASTIKDVIPRYQTMKGRFVRRRWGWDCHGLPIEEIVERKLKISGKKQIEKIGIEKFNKTCRSEVLRYAKEWGKMVARIARFVEFDNSYKTMDQGYMESVWWAFKEIYKKGLIYEGRKVLLYCPRCETPISNFEVAMDDSYKDVTEEAITVKFQIHPPSLPPLLRGGNKGGVYMLAWTTTPWTLMGNVALAVGKKITYVIFKIKNQKSKIKNEEYYIVAKDRANSVIASTQRARGNPNADKIASSPPLVAPRNDIEILGEFKGKDLIGLEYEPLFEVLALREPINGRATAEKRKGSVPIHRQKIYKIYPADFVNTQEGTGIVHTAVCYGEDDYELGLKHSLPVVPLLDERGKFNEKAPRFLQGVDFKEAETLIKADLEKRGLLFARKAYTHSYPHCWRCESMLFYNAIPAWFIKISKIKNQILKSNKKEINWYPEHLKFGRYAKSVEAAPDWNISRNRYWGNPMPVWKCQSCKNTIVIGSIKELVEKSDTNIPMHSNVANSSHSREDSRHSGRFLDLHRPYIDEIILKCDKCGGKARRIKEIFDSWFEAASMPFASVHYPFTSYGNLPARSSLRHQALAGGKVSVTKNDVAEVFRPPSFPFPADFVAEYIAQTRAWFYVMHVISLILFGKAPFENVVTTGTILNERGEKLSKSRKNFPDPWEIINRYGVDTLRFYLMNSVVMQGDDLFFNEQDLVNVQRKVVLILWNVYSYFVTYANANRDPNTRNKATLIYLPDFALAKSRRAGELHSNDTNSRHSGGDSRHSGRMLDQWILARLQELTNQVTKYLDNYDTVHATREIEAFINDLSTWYLRRSRGREDKAFLETLRYCLLELSKVTAPFMPYIAEIIYRNLVVDSDTNTRMHTNDSNPPHPSSPTRGEELKERGVNSYHSSRYISVHLCDWPETKKLTTKQKKLLRQMQGLREIVEQAHALRAKAGIKLRQPLARLIIPKRPINGQLREPINGRATNHGSVPIHRQLLEILKDEVNVKKIVFGKKLELDTKITNKLKTEGLVRELERQINQLRKESGLKIGELVDLYYQTDSDVIKKAMKMVDRKKVYVKNLQLTTYNIQLGHQKEIEVEGEKIFIKLVRQ